MFSDLIGNNKGVMEFFGTDPEVYSNIKYEKDNVAPGYNKESMSRDKTFDISLTT